MRMIYEDGSSGVVMWSLLKGGLVNFNFGGSDVSDIGGGVVMFRLKYWEGLWII